MLRVDVVAIKEWWVEHKNNAVIFLATAFTVFICMVILYKPLLNLYRDKEGVVLLTQKIEAMKKMIDQKNALKKTQENKLYFFQKLHGDIFAVKPAVVWIGQNLRQCQVSQFRFEEDGNLEMVLSFNRALCVLKRFSEKSIGWNLLGMTINREERGLLLTMQLSLTSS